MDTLRSPSSRSSATQSASAPIAGPTFYNVAQAAALLGVSRVTLWRWIRAGRLPAARLGHRTTRISRNDLEHLLAQHSSGFQVVPAEQRGGGILAAAGARDARAPRADWWAAGPAEHLVLFYDRDAFCLAAMCDFLGAALRAGDSAIIIATRTHRERLAALLRTHGLDLTAARAQGRYIALDAAETLARCMADDALDPDRLAAVFQYIIARATAGGRDVRVFGEMGPLLARAGNHAAALRLEQSWHTLQESWPFALFCAYPLACVQGTADAVLVAALCAAHVRVVPAESYTGLDDTDDRLGAIAVLQQQAYALAATCQVGQFVEWQQGDEERRRLVAAEQAARVASEAALRRLRAVQMVSDPALTHLPPEELLPALLARLTEALSVDNVAVLILGDNGRHLVLYMARGPEERVVGQVSVPFGEGIAGTIAATGQPMVAEDLSAVAVANPFLKQTIHSLMGVPLVAADRLIGVLHAGTTAPRHFAEDDLLPLRLVADRIALVLDRR